ncbi:MAG TPA: DNA primase [Rhodanobacteraceae bacterium]|nr:DNA primase [Rhodanobacteraceae bacterium]
MPGLIPERFIDELLARVDIVDVVQPRVALKRAGREWTACCPFHDERTPSFYVSPAKQFYHCFGCGAHGSAIKFLMEYERLEFPDAVEELAQSVGLTVPHEGGPARPREDHTDLYTLLDAAATFYQRALPQSAAAKAYCKKRGLDPDIIQRFRIGWAPGGWDALKRALGTDAAKTKLLEQAGMLSSGDAGKQFDRFRERVMFPILDRRGRVIAFGGRVISSASNAHSADSARGEGPKYLNSPETPLFHKGRELFALWQAREANRKLERLIVVEGYMDVVALHQAGVTQAVATLGTSTTNEHAELLFRAAPDVYFCFDGDKPGRSAAWRAVESVLPAMRDNRRASFLFLPEGEDPDTLVRKEGKEGFERRIASAMPLSDYFFDFMSRDMNFSSVDGKTQMAEYATPLLAKLPDSAFRDSIYEELWKRTWVRVDPRRSPVAPKQTWTASEEPTRRTLVRSTIAMLLNNPSLAQGAELPYPFATLDRPGVPLLIELLDAARAQPDVSAARLLEQFGRRREASALQKLALTEFPGEPEALHLEFADALRKLAQQTTQQRIDTLIAMLREGTLDETGKNELRALQARKARPAAL